MSEIRRKPGNLASAIYLITSFFNDHEPIKWKLRFLTSELVPLTVSLKNDLLKERGNIILEVKNNVLKITELLILAKNVGLVSSLNHDLIQDECTKYVNSLDESVDISSFLNNGDSLLKIEVMGQNNINKDNKESQISEKGHLSVEPPKTKSLKGFGVVSVKKNSRQSAIIALLKRKKEVMIKDISAVITDCGEKTIQRELLGMVQTGLLKKVGKKRWSRYSLA